MPKRKAKRKDKTIPTLDDVVLKKTQDEATDSTAPEVKSAEQKDSIEANETEKPGAEPAETDAVETEANEKPVDKKQDGEVPQKEKSINEDRQKEIEKGTAETQINPQVNVQTKTQETNRRVEDRRLENVPLHSGESDRRVSQRRKRDSRTSDRVINAQLDPLIEKILKEMIPDIEEHIETKLGAEIKTIVSNIMPELQQHMRMQLRFEIDKHMSKILRAGIHTDSIVHPDDEY